MREESPGEKAVKRFFFEVVEKQKLDVTDEIIHPDYQHSSGKERTSQSEMIWGGVDGFKNRMAQVFQFLKLDIEILDFFENNNIINSRIVIKMHHVGKFLGFPPTGAKIDMLAFFQFWIKDGKIIKLSYLTDFFKFLQTTGLAVIEQNNQTLMAEYLENLQRLGVIPKE